MLDTVENAITDFFVKIIKSFLFFLNGNQQSFFVSILHYVIFFIGFYYFFFISKPGDTFRIFFFIFVLFGALSYYIFNKCLFTSIEIKLSDKKNAIQNLMSFYFGQEIEGNKYSKRFLGFSAIVLGMILIYDYYGNKNIINTQICQTI